MRTCLPLIAILCVTACASPAERMIYNGVAALSDYQLCHLQNSYRSEPKTMVEIGRRGLNCDPAATACMARGVANNSPSMPLCMSAVNMEWQSAYMMQAANARADYAMYQLGDESSTKHVYVNTANLNPYWNGY